MSINFFILLLCFSVHINLFANPRAPGCKVLGHSSWLWSDSRLISASTNIFVGSIISGEESDDQASVQPSGIDFGISHLKKMKWKIKIFSVLKGSKKIGDTVEIVSPRINLPHGEISKKHCLQSLNFIYKKKYLIFENSYHPRGYLELEKAEKLIKLIEKEKS